MKRLVRLWVGLSGLTLLAALLMMLSLMMPSLVTAQDVSPTKAMLVANQHYEAGEFIEAVDIYESIVTAGVQDETLYYNLGNAYYKTNDLGRAILNYRRAQYLDPRDSDTATNLAVARLQTLDQLEKTEEGLLTNLVEVAEGWLTLTEALIFVLIMWLLICGLTIVAILSAKFRQVSLWGGAIVGVILLIGLFSIGNRYYLQQTSPVAVIVAQDVDITSGPGSGDQYLIEFNLHSGAEVRILASRPKWRRIALPGNNFQGWLPAEAVELVIVP